MRLVSFFLFLTSFVFFYFFDIESPDSMSVLLSVSTFTFSVFMGFFISRQGKRYSSLVDKVSTFDGLLGAIYREVGHISITAQKKLAKVYLKHYDAILTSKSWDYHLMNPSNTITSIHTILDESTAKMKSKAPIKTMPIMRILTSLDQLQVIRKEMVSLHNERIHSSQWGLLIVLSVLVFLAISGIPSAGDFIPSAMKAGFSSAIFISLILLHQLDVLRFFEGTLGESSAHDMIGIINGVK